jgi:hypothetical protein
MRYPRGAFPCQVIWVFSIYGLPEFEVKVKARTNLTGVRQGLFALSQIRQLPLPRMQKHSAKQYARSF